MPDKISFRVLVFLLLFYSLISLQWNWPNLGNDLTPRIFISWAMLIACTAWCWGQAFHSGKLLLDKSFTLFLLPPIAIGLFSIFGPIGSKEYYPFLAFFALFFTALWITGLIQMELSSAQWEILGWIIASGSVLLCFFALISPPYFNISKIFSLLPIPLTVNQAGFQQPNLFASYLATTISLLYWLTLSHEGARSKLKNTIFFVFTFILSLTLFSTGSRAGLLGGSLSFTLLITWSSINNKCSWKFNTGWALTILAGLILSTFLLNQINADRSVTNRLGELFAGATGSAQRIPIWRVSLKIWLEHPWLGVGIGRFTEFYTDYYVQLVNQGEHLTYLQNLDHPHCELLLWLDETGLIGTSLVLLPFVGFILNIFIREKLQLLGWFAVLIPITLHSLVEFPFHSSGAHWFIFGFAIAAGVHTLPLKTHSIDLPELGLKIGRIIILSVFSIPVLILIQTAYTSKLALEHMFARERFLEDHLIKWSQSPEFNHPILGRLTNDMFMSNTVPLIVSSGDLQLIKTWTPVIENLALRWQNDMVWTALAVCYISNKEPNKLDKLVYKLKVVNPEMAQRISEARTKGIQNQPN